MGEKVLPKIEEEVQATTNPLVNDARATLSRLTVENKVKPIPEELATKIKKVFKQSLLNLMVPK